MSDLERVRRERDLYWRLLELATKADLPAVLGEALELIVDVTGARRGCLVLVGDDGPRFAVARGCSDAEIARIREAISYGIIGEAMASGRTLLTQSALDDPRFAEHKSVQANRIGAVLCAPIGPHGVVYLQDRDDGAIFDEEDRRRAEAFARHLVPIVHRLAGPTGAVEDPTAALRSRMKLDLVVGRSRALASTLEAVERAAPFTATVVITGPTGAGKTVLARAVHDNGPRAACPFVAINCSTIQKDLAESALFGHVKGSFTGAHSDQPGCFAAADRGTLFLDEVDQLHPAVQAKLLHAIEAGTFLPLGGTVPRTVDVRVIAATNADLEAAVLRNDFRNALFFRLQVLKIRLPALNERREDVPLLAAFFVQRAARRNGLTPPVLARSALVALETADWPGNVRQLANTVEAGVIHAVSERSDVIEARHLFPDVAPAEGGATFQGATRQFQRRLVADTLARTAWNVSEAARQLDISRSYLHELITALGVKR